MEHKPIMQGPLEVKTGGCFYFKEAGMGGIATDTFEMRNGKLRRLFYPGFIVKESARHKDYPTEQDCITLSASVWIADSRATIPEEQLKSEIIEDAPYETA